VLSSKLTIGLSSVSEKSLVASIYLLGVNIYFLSPTGDLFGDTLKLRAEGFFLRN
jgi:hypothetical protein